MFNLCLAEFRKLTRHYLLLVFTLGLLFIGGLFITMVGTLLYWGADATMRASLQSFWVMSALDPWDFLTSEGVPFGRIFPLLFMAAACGAEYQTGMWKNFLPGQARFKLLLAKFLTLVAVAWGAFLLLSGWSVLSDAWIMWVAGRNDFWVAVDGGFGLKDLMAHWPAAMGAGLLTLLFLASLTLAAVVRTRTTFGTLVMSIGFVLFEGLFAFSMSLLSQLVGVPGLKVVAQLSPTYNIANLEQWTRFHEGLAFMTSPPSEPFSFAASALVIAAWIVGLGALAVWQFQTQDIVQ